MLGERDHRDGAVLCPAARSAGPEQRAGEACLPARQTVASLRAYLRSRGGPWEAELAADKPVRAAVNQDMAQADTAAVGRRRGGLLSSGDGWVR